MLRVFIVAHLLYHLASVHSTHLFVLLVEQSEQQLGEIEGHRE